MSTEEALEKMKQDIFDSLPKSAKITEVQFEGPEISIYSRSVDFIGDDREEIRNLVKKLRKRIVVRSDPEIRMINDETVAFIQKTIPEEAEVTKIMFNENLGEVIIEAKKPGVAIGKSGTNLKTIKKETMWLPQVIRTPPIESRTVALVRSMLQKERQEQKEIFRKIGWRIHRPLVKNDFHIKMTCLGSFREVGRSSILIETNESNVLLDCGLNVGNSDDLFPYLDVGTFKIEDLDAVILSHAHLDHSGLIPFLFKYGYDGPVYTTEPTMHLSTMLQLDYVNICAREGRPAPYSKNDIKKAILHTYTLEWGKVTDITPDIKLTLHNAGHILGSSMIHLHFGNGEHNLVFTGDYKFQRTRLLEAASCKFPRLETLITESTYGGVQDIMPSRHESEKMLIQILNNTIRSGGKVLIPVLAVGRAQEIMVVLEDFMSRKMVDQVPIYVDGMISEATAIHTTHPDYLNSELREKIFHQGKNPFTSEIFTQVDGYQARDDIIAGGPCIIMATSGMLQGGPSVQYLKGIAEDPNSAIIFASYQVEGTLGRRIQKGYREFQAVSSSGKTTPVKIKLNVHTIEGFSGHSNRSQIISFIRKVKPRPERVITLHGESSKCMGLASVIHKRLKSETRSPVNMETILLK
ncbi:MAG: beta-CASP ribonuclease aCPSF1 [Candidatus Lokiarchaeota archaeon]|nr:beta-CASP ribonuclease aCPSF1 [Candidatus Harpocratesius repetitus]